MNDIIRLAHDCNAWHGNRDRKRDIETLFYKLVIFVRGTLSEHFLNLTTKNYPRVTKYPAVCSCSTNCRRIRVTSRLSVWFLFF